MPKARIRKALASSDPISRDQLRAWCDEAHDIEALALLYRLTSQAWSRIEPPPNLQETSALIRRYLLRCIQEAPAEKTAFGRYHAAYVLESWFDHLANLEEGQEVLRESAAAVTELFLDGDDAIRDAITDGFLEHVLEQTRMREFFRHWADDERLRPAWASALAWGQAHPDFMRGLRTKGRAVDRS